MKFFISTRLCLIILMVILALTSVLPVHQLREQADAADAGFSAWLINTLDQRLVNVTADGSQSYVWPFSLSPYSISDLAISPDGRMLGACLLDSATGQWGIGIANLEAGAIVVETPLENPIGCSTTRASFNAEGTHFAYSVVNYLPGDLANPADSTTRPVASLNVVDVTTGALVSSLEFTLEGLTNLFQEQIQHPPTAILPIIVDFRAGLVSFQLVPYAVGGTFVLTAEQWLFEAGISERVEKYAHAGLQILPATGEVAWPDVSNTYPVAQAPGPIPSYNVVRYAMNETTTIFTPQNFSTTRALVVQVEWANDGQVLLIHLLGEQLPDLPNLPEFWVALSRDGSLREMPAVEGFQVMGAPGGFVHLVTTYQGEGFANPTTRLEYVTFTNDPSAETTTETIWEEASESWILLWTSPSAVPTDLPPFPAIAN